LLRQYSQPEGSGQFLGCPQCQNRQRSAGYAGSWSGLSTGQSVSGVGAISGGGGSCTSYSRHCRLGGRQTSVSACGECIASIAADTVKYNGGLRQFKQVEYFQQTVSLMHGNNLYFKQNFI